MVGGCARLRQSASGRPVAGNAKAPCVSGEKRGAYDPAVAIELTDELITLERAAWAEQQAGALTIPTAHAVQAAVTAHAKATGQSRYEVEQAVKRAVRHPDS